MKSIIEQMQEFLKTATADEILKDFENFGIELDDISKNITDVFTESDLKVYNADPSTEWTKAEENNYSNAA